MADRWSDGLNFVMAPRHPGKRVPDVITNAQECLMVSDRLKSLLSQTIHSPVEYLPFILLNHKGRVADDSMWVVNLLDTVECADLEKSKGSKSPFHEGEIQDLVELHVLPERMPSDRQLFRVRECPAVMLARDDLRARMESEGMTASYHALGVMI